MPLAELMEQPFLKDDHMFRTISDICVQMQRHRRRYCGLTAHNVVSKFDGRTSTLYYNVAVVEPERGGGDLEDCHCDAADLKV